jgi:hypothetical protein
VTGFFCSGCEHGPRLAYERAQQTIVLLRQHVAYLEMRCEELGIPFADLVAAGLVSA